MNNDEIIEALLKRAEDIQSEAKTRTQKAKASKYWTSRFRRVLTAEESKAFSLYQYVTTLATASLIREVCEAYSTSSPVCLVTILGPFFKERNEIATTNGLNKMDPDRSPEASRIVASANKSISRTLARFQDLRAAIKVESDTNTAHLVICPIEHVNEAVEHLTALRRLAEIRKDSMALSLLAKLERRFAKKPLVPVTKTD